MRFLPLVIIAALLGAGCANPSRKLAQQAERETSRAVEERRLRAVDGRDVASKRGAEVFVADPTKKFDLGQRSVGSGASYGTGRARTREFAFEQKVNPRTFQARDFYGAKSARAAQRSFATAEANTRGSYSIPNADTRAATKTAETTDARESGKTAATREAPGSNRPFLGRESEKLGTTLDPNNLPRTSNELRELKTIEDVRELLNKNK